MSIDPHMAFGALLANIGEPAVYTADWIEPYVVQRLLLTTLLISLWFAFCGALVFLVYFLLTLPMRRAERARLFLNLLESVVQQGRPLEQTLISISHIRDPSLGIRFHLFAAWLERSLSFHDALAKVPRFLPPQITAMLMAGQKIGDLGKVLPACRQLLRDAISQMRDALNYLVIITFVITPLSLFVFGSMEVMVIPKYREISAGTLGGDITGVNFLASHESALITIQLALLLLLWLAAFLYIAGPRLAVLFPVLDQLYFRVPWRRKRLQRDFSTMLAILLDSGVPEPEALTLAADATANSVFRARAARAVDRLRQGVKLTQAVQSMDDSGEFAWRLANAFHGHTGFLQALAGWHESLDAKAFQQEQAASQGITTALVLWTGLFVGTVAVSAFLFLTSLVNSAVLW